MDSTSATGGRIVGRPVPQSPTLAINEQVRARIAAGRPVIHLGFGEAGLPAAPELVSRLAGAAGANDYRPSAGSVALREAVAGHFGRRGIATDARQIVTAPGSKALLFALIRVLPGDVILPAPSWVSYAAQAAITGKRIGRAPIPAPCGGIPDPVALRATVRTMRTKGASPGILVLTSPDNPTGTVAPRHLVEQVCAVAAEEELFVIADEIYRDLAYIPGSVTDPAAFLPDSTFVTSGLSKNLALGGWRIGYARFPDSPAGESAREAVIGVASEIWSSTPAPMEDVATWAMTEPAELRERIARSRALHSRVAGVVHDIISAAGAACRRPTAAFYVYPDLGIWAAALAHRGVRGDVQVADWLLDSHDVAVLPGSAFGDDPAALRFRLSTSLLYGRTAEQREQALAADDATALPWVGESLGRLRAVFAALAALG